MYPSHASSLKSVGLLMYASEPAAPATIANVERLLEQRASIDPADVMLVHLNLGTMLTRFRPGSADVVAPDIGRARACLLGALSALGA